LSNCTGGNTPGIAALALTAVLRSPLSSTISSPEIISVAIAEKGMASSSMGIWGIKANNFSVCLELIIEGLFIVFRNDILSLIFDHRCSLRTPPVFDRDLLKKSIPTCLKRDCLETQAPFPPGHLHHEAMHTFRRQ